MFILVTYDIPDDKRRLRTMHTLEGFGTRVQRSVFECNLSQEQYRNLKRGIAGRLSEQEDGVRYYNLCQVCRGKVEIQGLGQTTMDETFYVV